MPGGPGLDLQHSSFTCLIPALLWSGGSCQHVPGGAVQSMCWHVSKTAVLLELDLAFTQLSVTISVFILTIIYA